LWRQVFVKTSICEDKYQLRQVFVKKSICEDKYLWRQVFVKTSISEDKYLWRQVFVKPSIVQCLLPEENHQVHYNSSFQHTSARRHSLLQRRVLDIATHGLFIGWFKAFIKPLVIKFHWCFLSNSLDCE